MPTYDSQDCFLRAMKQFIIRKTIPFQKLKSDDEEYQRGQKPTQSSEGTQPRGKGCKKKKETPSRKISDNIHKVLEQVFPPIRKRAKDKQIRKQKVLTMTSDQEAGKANLPPMLIDGCPATSGNNKTKTVVQKKGHAFNTHTIFKQT